MKIVKSKLDYSTKWQLPDVYIFTGNSYITKHKRLVMGRGAALQCKNSWLGIDRDFGRLIEKKPNDYGLIFTPIDDEQFLGVFQVKKNFTDKADINLIENSTRILRILAKNKPHITFHMNFPGIGYGGLSYNTVFPIVEYLPDNVILYL